MTDKNKAAGRNKTVWFLSNNWDERIDAYLAKEFIERTGQKLAITDAANLDTPVEVHSLMDTIKNGTCPYDVIHINHVHSSTYEKAGYLFPLKNPLKDLLKERLYPEIVEAESRGGELYAVPVGVYFCCFLYNKGLLAENRIDLPGDFNGLVTVLRQLSKCSKELKHPIIVQDTLFTVLFYAFLYSGDGAKRKYAFSLRDVENALEYCRLIDLKYNAFGGTDRTEMGIQECYSKGKAAFVLNFNNVFPSLCGERGGPRIDTGLLPLSFGTKSRNSLYSAVNMAVPSTSKNKKGAIEFLKMVFDSEVDLKIRRMGNSKSLATVISTNHALSEGPLKNMYEQAGALYSGVNREINDALVFKYKRQLSAEIHEYLKGERSLSASAQVIYTRMKSWESANINEVKLLRAVQFMKDNYSRKISLEDVAGFSGLSKFHFSRVFSSGMGLGFNDYLNEYRINEARKLLAERLDLTIGAIAEQTGFSDQFWFAKVFKKVTGTTPSGYRSTHIAV